MKEFLGNNLESLPAQVLRQIDRLCDAFEAEWKAGGRPEYQAYLGQIQQNFRRPMFLELLGVEVAYRHELGECPSQEEYVMRFPDLADVVAAAFARLPAAAKKVTPELVAKWKLSWMLNNSFRRVDEDRPQNEPGWVLEEDFSLSALSQPLEATRPLPMPAPDLALSSTPQSGPTVVQQPEQVQVEDGAALNQDYVMLDRLGGGGEGTVYKAFEKSTDRIVAVKVIKPAMLQQLAGEARQRKALELCQETQMAGKLEHDHIVPLYRVGVHDDRIYLVFRFVDGPSMADLIYGEGPMASRPAAQLIEQAARGVHFAHSHKILHCDIKPRNILIERKSNRAYITDFGLARRVLDLQESRATGGPVGTYPYMSPEQGRDAARVRVQSDVYGLGASLYMALTGRPPFQAATAAETLRQIREVEPVAPRKLNPNVDRELETIILKCLEKDSRQRYQSAELLADDLRAYLEGRPIKARPVRWPGRAWRWCRRNPWLSAAAITAAVAMLATSALSAYSLQMNRVAEARRLALEASNRAVVERTLERADELCRRGEVAAGLLWKARGLELAQEHYPELDEYLRRDLAAWRLHTATLRAFLPLDRTVNHILLSADDRYLITVDDRQKYFLWRLYDGSPVRCDALSGEEGSDRLQFCGHGTIASYRGNRVNLVQLSTETVRHTFERSDSKRVRSIATDASGKKMFLGLETGVVERWDLESRRLESTFTTAPKPDWLTLAPDGATVLAVAQTGPSAWQVRLWQTSDGKPIGSPMITDVRISSVAYSPQNDFVVVGSRVQSRNRGEIRILDLQTGKERNPGSLSVPGSLAGVFFDRDGVSLQTLSLDVNGRGELTVWDVKSLRLLESYRVPSPIKDLAVNSTGQEFVTADLAGQVRIWARAPRYAMAGAVTLDQDALGIAFDPGSGSVLAGGFGGAAIWRPGDPAVRRLLRDKWTLSAAFSPDGALLATGSIDGVRVWHSDGRLVRHLPDWSGWVPALAFSPDGKVLVACCDDGFLVWSVPSLEVSHKYQVEKSLMQTLAFSPDGRLLLTGSFTGLSSIWKTDTWQIQGPPVQHSSPVMHVAFRKDGKQYVTGDGDRTAQVWDVESGQPVGYPILHAGTVRTVGFDEKDSFIFSADGGHCVQLYDASEGRQIGPPLLHPFKARCALLAQEDNTMITAGDSIIRFWRLPVPEQGSPDEIRRRIVRQTGLVADDRGVLRSLKREEWQALQASMAAP